MIDSTIIRAHHCAAGCCWRKRGAPRQGPGRSRGGFTTKIHLRTNGEGLPVAVEMTAGETADYAGFEPLMAAEGPKPNVLIADRGYDADHIRKTMESRKTATVIPMRKSRKIQVPVDAYIYALRNRIERCFNRLKNARRMATRYDKMATRYDKTLESYRGFVIVAAIRLWIHAFVNRTWVLVLGVNWFVFREPIYPAQIIGSILILCGVWLIATIGKSRAEEP